MAQDECGLVADSSFNPYVFPNRTITFKQKQKTKCKFGLSVDCLSVRLPLSFYIMLVVGKITQNVQITIPTYCNYGHFVIHFYRIFYSTEKRGSVMDVRYNKLFKLMIDKGMKKTDLLNTAGISKNTLSKFSKNEYISMEVLVKVCRVLDCDIGDIMEVLPESRYTSAT